MDQSHLSHLLRRSRLRPFAAGVGHIDLGARSPNESSENTPKLLIEKRAPQDDTNNPHVNHGQAVAATRTVGQAVGQVAGTSTRQAAQAATLGTTRSAVNVVETATRSSAAAESSAKKTLEAASSSSKKTIDFGTPSTSSAVAAVTSATPSSTFVAPSTSSAVPSSTSTSTSTPSSSSTSTRTSTSTSTTATSVQSSSSASVRALTVSTTSTSAAATSTLEAGTAGKSSSGMSTGGIVGLALGAIVGAVVIGSFIGWLYRKWTARSYNSQAPWAKIDDDITPYPHSNEKFSDNGHGDDIYGGSVAPVIGSRKALAMARDHAYTDSDMYERGNNRAGVGAGALDPYSPYPQFSPPSAPAYGLDAQGRPYTGQAGRTPMQHTYDNQYGADPCYDMPQDNARQLIGPNGQAHPYASAVPMPTPVPMGRPAAPSTAAEFALCEDFADEPEPLTPGYAYPIIEPRTPTSSEPRTAGRSRVSMSTPQGSQGPRVLSPTESIHMHDYIPAPALAVPPPAATSGSIAPMPLPNFAPLSPLMSDFDFKRRSQPLAMYEDEMTAQKKMYGEVASAAGISEPVTPHSAQPSPNIQGDLNQLTTSTTSSFSAPQPDTSMTSSSSMPRLPDLALPAPEPYQHGQPLSPLKEVPTPLSTAATGEPFLNPFDLPLPTRPGGGNSLAPPFSASTSGATGFPSPAYPPPSPGGMSVPGSVTDSPRRWDSSMGTPKGRAVSVCYDEEDAYGGI